MIVLTHNGYDSLNNPVSSIYLGDLLRRTGLGGGVVNGQNGQDCYIKPFQSLVLSPTSEFKLSLAVGSLKSYKTRGVFSINSQFDALLEKLDNDTHVSFTDYYQSFNLLTGENPITLFNSLLLKLDNDIGLALEDYSDLEILPDNTFSTQYNLLLQKLDLDNGATDIDYFDLLKE